MMNFQKRTDMPDHNKRDLWFVLLILGALYTLVPLFIIRRLCAEKTWMRFFKADKLVEQVTKN